MKEYKITNKDIEAVIRLLNAGGDMANLTRDDTTHTPFECGILSKKGYTPIAYGGGETIASAINEAIGMPNGEISVSGSDKNRAIEWILNKNLELVVR